MIKKEAVATKSAPSAIGPYSQAVKAGGFVFCSGQIPLDPVSGEMKGETIEEQTREALKNLGAVLTAAGVSLDDVVKTTVYLKDLKTFGAMNGVYGEFFKPPYPARATIEAAGLPKGALVEIDAVAIMPGN